MAGLLMPKGVIPILFSTAFSCLSYTDHSMVCAWNPLLPFVINFVDQTPSEPRVNRLYGVMKWSRWHDRQSFSCLKEADSGTKRAWLYKRSQTFGMWKIRIVSHDLLTRVVEAEFWFRKVSYHQMNSQFGVVWIWVKCDCGQQNSRRRKSVPWDGRLDACRWWKDGGEDRLESVSLEGVTTYSIGKMMKRWRRKDS